jgi:hypothetical protein
VQACHTQYAPIRMPNMGGAVESIPRRIYHTMVPTLRGI